MENETPGPFRTEVHERILQAAAGLFAQFGYNCTSTRSIASVAEVNEVTIYRHYPRKRDLCLAVLANELRKITVPGDLLTQVTQASDAKSALANAARLISLTLAEPKGLIRLLHYSSLELNHEADSILRIHLGEIVEVVARLLQPWIRNDDDRCGSPKLLALSLIAIFLSHDSLRSVFAEEVSNAELMLSVYTDLVISDTAASC